MKTYILILTLLTSFFCMKAQNKTERSLPQLMEVVPAKEEVEKSYKIAVLNEGRKVPIRQHSKNLEEPKPSKVEGKIVQVELEESRSIKEKQELLYAALNNKLLALLIENPVPSPELALRISKLRAQLKTLTSDLEKADCNE